MQDIIHRFTYHAPKAEQIPKYNLLRDAARSFALLISETCPEGREKSLAITKIEESVMWANAAIARETQPSS